MNRLPFIRAATASAMLACLSLAACGSVEKPPPDIKTVRVEVPVPVSCVPEGLPAKPDFKVTREDLRKAPDLVTRYQLAVGGFLERDQRLAEVEPTIAACRKVAP